MKRLNCSYVFVNLRLGYVLNIFLLVLGAPNIVNAALLLEDIVYGIMKILIMIPGNKKLMSEVKKIQWSAGLSYAAWRSPPM